MDESINKLNALKTELNKPNPKEIIVYKGIKIPLSECMDRGTYWFMPRDLVNKFNKQGYELVPKSECVSFMDYVKELEHYRDTTLGLYATDRPDLIKDEQNLMFELTQ